MIILRVIVPLLFVTAVDCLFYYDIRVRRAQRGPFVAFVLIGAASYVVPFLAYFGQQIVSPGNILHYRSGAAVLVLMLACYAVVAMLYYAIAFVLTESLVKRRSSNSSLIVASSMAVFFVLQMPLAVVTMLGIPLLISGRLP